MVAGGLVLTPSRLIALLDALLGLVAAVAHGHEHHDGHDDDGGRERGERQQQCVVGNDLHGCRHPCGTDCFGVASVYDSRALIRLAPQVSAAISTSVQNSTTIDAAVNNHDGWFRLRSRCRMVIS